jgi:hypothetical protein
MGRLLAALALESETAFPAIHAIHAIPAIRSNSKIAGIAGATVAAVSTDQAGRLLAAIRAEFASDDLMGVADATPDELAALSDAALRAYVRMLHDACLRERGNVPVDETTVALCRWCGPVWIAPEVAAVAPVVDGLPRVLGCPWCHVKNLRPMARPKVTCGDCRYFARDTINPSEGMGSCKAGCDPARPYPMVKHTCEEWRP